MISERVMMVDISTIMTLSTTICFDCCMCQRTVSEIYSTYIHIEIFKVVTFFSAQLKNDYGSSHKMSQHWLKMSQQWPKMSQQLLKMSYLWLQMPQHWLKMPQHWHQGHPCCCSKHHS